MESQGRQVSSTSTRPTMKESNRRSYSFGPRGGRESGPISIAATALLLVLAQLVGYPDSALKFVAEAQPLDHSAAEAGSVPMIAAPGTLGSIAAPGQVQGGTGYNDIDGESDDSDVAPAIMNGLNATNPGFVANLEIYLSFVDGDWYRCGASLISDSWLVTAAHCLVDQGGPCNPGRRKDGYVNMQTGRCTAPEVVGPNALTVARLGGSDLRELKTDPKWHVSKFAEVWVHPEYLSVMDGGPGSWAASDVAVIRLASPAPPTLKPLQYSCNPEDPVIGSRVASFGWGTCKGPNCPPGTVLANRLQTTAPTGVPVIDCGPGEAPENYCLQGPGPILGLNASTCAGDSGGPNVVYRNGQPLLVGITSWGLRACGDPMKIAGQLRTGSVCEWIKKTSGVGSCTVKWSPGANLGGPGTTCVNGSTLARGSSCTVTCKNDTPGSVRVSCTELGALSSPDFDSASFPLKCNVCPALKSPTPAYNVAQCRADAEMGSKCTVSCGPDYKGTTSQFTCTASSPGSRPAWKGSLPLCSVNSCGDLSNVTNLSRGSGTAAQIRALQSKLNYYGAAVPVTGTFTDCTEATLKAFQTTNGLAPSGIVTIETRNKLCSLSSIALPPQVSATLCSSSTPPVSVMRRVNALWQPDGGIRVSSRPCGPPTQTIPACAAVQFTADIRYTLPCLDGTRGVWYRLVYNNAPVWHRLETKGRQVDVSLVVANSAPCVCLPLALPGVNTANCVAGSGVGSQCNVQCARGFSGTPTTYTCAKNWSPAALSARPQWIGASPVCVPSRVPG